MMALPEITHGGLTATSPNGFTHTFEIRPNEGEKLLTAIEMFEGVLLKQGWQARGSQWAVNSEQSDAPQPVSATGHSFSAESLVVTIDSGKRYFKVKGGQFAKFGVFIWPEALIASGIDVDGIDPIRGMNLSGWTAEYVTNEDGNPKKVVRLSR